MLIRSILPLLILAASFANGAHAGVDPAELLQRLENIGLETGTIRALLGSERLGIPVVSPKVRISFFRHEKTAIEAQYDWRTNWLSVPRAYGNPAGNGFRADLNSQELDTLLHELCHAEDDFDDDVVAQLTRERPSAAQLAKREVIAELQKQHSGTARRLGLSTGTLEHGGKLLAVSHWAAWEVAGYATGAAIDDLFFVLRDILNMNENLPSTYMHTAEERARWAATDDLALPARYTDKKSFGARDTVDAYLFGHPIPYRVKGNEALLEKLYLNTLGLNPPRTARDLVDRLNRQDNAWIRAVRARVRKARQDYVAHEAALRARPLAPGEATTAEAGLPQDM